MEQVYLHPIKRNCEASTCSSKVAHDRREICKFSHHLWSFQSHIFFALIVDDLCLIMAHTTPTVPQIFCVECWYISFLHFMPTSKLGHIGNSNGPLIFCHLNIREWPFFKEKERRRRRNGLLTYLKERMLSMRPK